jgi:cephalosporin-C deacetylase-like acetyl esterase
MNQTIRLFFCVVFFASGNILAQDGLERQQQYLKDILDINLPQRFKENTRRVNLKDSTWQEWLTRTKELPPDFSKMRSSPMLPDPLIQYKNGKEVEIKTKEEWEEKRKWIKKEYQHWISGQFPPAPKSVKAELLSERTEGETLIQLIRLKFGPQDKAVMNIELMIPKARGVLPVYMTQWTHRGWAQLAVRRGYIACVYAAADSKDDTEAYQALYPDYDFSMLMRRAWGASRVVDYLLTRKEVNKNQIAVSGHSRNGKQSLWAAAFDERIAAAISNSSSTGGDAPWRFSDPQYVSETLDYVTALNGHWFHPRLRFFSGREDKLPIDQDLLGALIAPRGLLYHYSIVERGLNPWANEQNYYSVKKVYDFLNAPNNIGVLTRMGEHAVAARDVEKTIDFLDIQFKRNKLTWHNQLYYTYSYTDWQKQHPADLKEAMRVSPIKLKGNYSDTVTFSKDRKKIIANLNWILGDEPTGVKAANVGVADPSRRDWIDKTIGRPEVSGAKEIYLGPYTAMGDHVAGILYCPADKSGKINTDKGKIPVVIYLHQYAHSTGYAKGYGKNGGMANKLLFQEMVKKGFAVLSIDMFGFGTRIDEATNFYTRFPQWSKMGKMINDVKGCIDALESLDYIDRNGIYLLGNTIGGSVALMTTAVDRRVAGLAVVAAFSPWRASNKQYESLKNYSHLHGFIPRLGFFAERPQQVPIDFAEIIAGIAPKPLMIIAPDLDRYADIPAVKKDIQSASVIYNLYNKKDNLTVKYPREINRLNESMNVEIANFYESLYKKSK